jgi:uncharacterized NAD(P)/FAD-binding protein YdhS
VSSDVPGACRDRPVVGIVGAGFSGTMVAAQLLRQPGGPLDVVLVERTGRFGPGLAYGARDDRHLLNAPAERMSAFEGAPLHFSQWAEARLGQIATGSYLPRRLYGEYLESVLDDAAGCAPEHRRLHRVVDTVVDARERPDGIELSLGSGGRVRCDRVVVATGNAPQTPLPGLPRDPRIVTDPWAPGALCPHPAAGTILVVGTGLTAVDAVLSITAGGAGPSIIAVSQRGGFPHTQVADLYEASPPPPIPPGPITVDEAEQHVRDHVDRMTDAGYGWRAAIDGLRPTVPQLWMRMPLDERRRFLAGPAGRWDRCRHRTAPEAAQRLRWLDARGRLEVVGGRVVSGRATAAGIEVEVEEGERRSVIAADRVVVCAGPARDVTRVSGPFERALLRRGLATPDPLGLGLRAAPNGALLGVGDEPSRRLFTLGPPLRGELWETTAVADIRVQAERLATALDASLAERASSSGPYEASMWTFGRDDGEIPGRRAAFG